MYNKRALNKDTKASKEPKKLSRKKDIIVDPMGQWNHPGEVTRIPGENITMSPDPRTGEPLKQPLLGVDNNGNQQMMYPGKEYTFPGAEYVDEFPQDKDAMNAMMKARLAYANEFGNPAAQRMITLPDNLYDFGDGNMGSHYMASMDNYAVPQIQDVNGKLVLGDFGPESNEAIRFDRPEDAEYFAEHYKDVSPAFIEAELTDEEIEAYRDGGYVLEELPKFQWGTGGFGVTTPEDLINKEDELQIRAELDKVPKVINVKNRNEDVINYYKQYMESPRYKEMLGADNLVMDMQRKYNLGVDWNKTPKLTVKYNQDEYGPNIGGYSVYDTGDITILPAGYNYKGVLPHEWSHAIDRPGKFYKERVIPKKDIDYINKVTPLDSEIRWDAVDWKNYVSRPTEVRARLNDIRYQSKLRNIYDPFTQKVTPEIYKKLLNVKFGTDENEEFDALQELKGIYTDEQIMYMLNNISQKENSQNKEFNFAQKGGPINDYKYGGSIPKYQTGRQKYNIQKPTFQYYEKPLDVEVMDSQRELNPVIDNIKFIEQAEQTKRRVEAINDLNFWKQQLPEEDYKNIEQAATRGTGKPTWEEEYNRLDELVEDYYQDKEKREKYENRYSHLPEWQQELRKEEDRQKIEADLNNPLLMNSGRAIARPDLIFDLFGAGKVAKGITSGLSSAFTRATGLSGLGEVLSTPAIIGGRALPGVTLGNALDLYAATQIPGLAKDTYTNLSEGNYWDAAATAGEGALYGLGFLNPMWKQGAKSLADDFANIPKFGKNLSNVGKLTKSTEEKLITQEAKDLNTYVTNLKKEIELLDKNLPALKKENAKVKFDEYGFGKVGKKTIKKLNEKAYNVTRDRLVKHLEGLESKIEKGEKFHRKPYKNLEFDESGFVKNIPDEIYHGSETGTPITLDKLQLDRKKLDSREFKTWTESSLDRDYGLFGARKLTQGSNPALKYSKKVENILKGIAKNPEQKLSENIPGDFMSNINLSKDAKILNTNSKLGKQIAEEFNILPGTSTSGQTNITEDIAKQIKDKYNVDGFYDSRHDEFLILNKNAISDIKKRPIKVYDYVDPIKSDLSVIDALRLHLREQVDKAGLTSLDKSGKFNKEYLENPFGNYDYENFLIRDIDKINTDLPLGFDPSFVSGADMNFYRNMFTPYWYEQFMKVNPTYLKKYGGSIPKYQTGDEVYQNLPEEIIYATPESRKKYQDVYAKAQSLLKTFPRAAKLFSENKRYKNKGIEGLSEYVKDVTDYQKNAEDYYRARQSVKSGKLSTDAFNRAYQERGWRQYDNKNVVTSPEDQEKLENIWYGTPDATGRRTWMDDPRNVVDVAKTAAIGSIGAAAAPILSPTIGAILGNPLVQAGLITHGAHHGVTKDIPEAYKDFSEGRYWEGLGNTGLAALNLAPIPAFGSNIVKSLPSAKQIRRAANYIPGLESPAFVRAQNIAFERGKKFGSDYLFDPKALTKVQKIDAEVSAITKEKQALQQQMRNMSDDPVRKKELYNQIKELASKEKQALAEGYVNPIRPEVWEKMSALDKQRIAPTGTLREAYPGETVLNYKNLLVNPSKPNVNYYGDKISLGNLQGFKDSWLSGSIGLNRAGVGNWAATSRTAPPLSKYKYNPFRYTYRNMSPKEIAETAAHETRHTLQQLKNDWRKSLSSQPKSPLGKEFENALVDKSWYKEVGELDAQTFASKFNVYNKLLKSGVPKEQALNMVTNPSDELWKKILKEPLIQRSVSGHFKPNVSTNQKINLLKYLPATFLGVGSTTIPFLGQESNTNSNVYKQGGSINDYKIGDEVDKDTYLRLKELGYEFE